MGLIFDVAVIFLIILICISAYFKWAFQYWKKKGVPYMEPSFPLGTFRNPLWDRKSFADIIKDQYAEAKARGLKHIGLYLLHVPFYMPVDLGYIKNVMVKDFDHFMDRGAYYNEEVDPLSASLFSLDGVKWRNLRMKLTPTFTSGKMKMMFSTLIECGKQLDNYMDSISLKNEPLDIKDILGRFTTDVIASCAFGIECNSFKTADSDFRKYLKRNFTIKNWQMIKVLVVSSMPSVGKTLGIAITPNEVSDYFTKVIDETVEFREKNKFVRKDFLQLLLELKNNVLESGGEYHHDGKSLTKDELAAQAFIFLAAGFETSSTTMTFCLYELTNNLDIQEKLREEVRSVLDKHDGKLTYDAVMEMKYMNQVIEETLRKYPPVPGLNRICVADYKLPDSNIIIEKGTLVTIPIIGLQMDEKYFPDPERFDPDRFNEENKHKIPHFSYMPFGEGPRICIGLRFGMMQTKVGLAILLKNYSFTLNKKTAMPLKLNPSSFILSTLGDIWLDARKLY